jgi:hypothetical protein
MMVRRSGRSPTGRAPARRPTASHHAPAAFTTTPAWKLRSPAAISQPSPTRAIRVTSARVTISPPRCRSPRRKASSSPATSMLMAFGSTTALTT